MKKSIKLPPLYIDLDSINHNIERFDNFSFQKLSNLILKNPMKENNEEIFIDGNSFIIDLFEKNYFHFIDVMAQFLFIKKYIKDLKLLIIEKESQYENDDPELFCSSFIDLIDKKDIVVVKNSGYSQIHIKNLFFVDVCLINIINEIKQSEFYTQEDIAYINKILSKTNEQYASNDGFGISVDYFKNLKEFFKYDHNLQNKKIFISTKIISDKVRKQKIILDIMTGVENEETKKLKEKEQIVDPNALKNQYSISYLKGNTKQRFISKHDEDAIHDYFIKNGYDFIDPTKMTIKEQIDLYRQCSHIATFSGSSCLASIFCNENTNFFVINLNLNYDFNHFLYVKNLVSNPVCVFYGASQNITYTAEEVIRELELKYKDLI